MLNPDHIAFADSVRTLAHKHVSPIADEMDRTDAFPMQVLEVFRDSGLVQLAVPTEFGGSGGDVTSICVAREEVARAGSMALATLAGQNNTLALALRHFGTAEQISRFMPELAKGAIACFCLTEADAGSDTGAMTTRARRDGGSWILNGQKSYISWGKLATYAIVFARSNDTPGSGGLTAFIVETDSPGFLEARHNGKLGQRGFPNVELVFDNLRVPAENILGQEGGGLRAALRGLHQNRPMMGAVALGGGLCALDYAINFLKQRSFRGQPMSSMQGLRWMVSDMATDLEAARCLIYECASQLDAGVPVDRIVRLSSMAKLVATESAVRVAGDALQLMGGAGYMTEHPVERYLRDAKATTIYEGTSQIQKNTIAASILDETARTG